MPTAKPPSEVSLYFELMSLAVAHIVSTTLSSGTLASFGLDPRASSAAFMALMAPIEFVRYRESEQVRQ